MRAYSFILRTTALLLMSAGAGATCPKGGHQAIVDPADGTCWVNVQSAINYAATDPTCPTTIHILPTNWTHQSLAVSGLKLTFQGWGDGVSCSSLLAQCYTPGDPNPHCPQPSATQPLVNLDGSNGGRVLTITGASDVTLRNIRVIHGDAGGNDGGGISFAGSGKLTLTRSDVSSNNAGYGGGINFKGSGGDASLYLLDDTTLLANTASVSGGGVRIEGTARLFALKPQTWIGFNHADSGYGGGVEILGPARADIGSPGYNGVAIVSNNHALNGGGIAVYDNGNGTGVLRTFPRTATTPTAISSNTADALGGGLYLYGGSGACLFAPRLVDNIAEDGAAIYEDLHLYSGNGSADAGVYVNGGWPAQFGLDCGPETVASLGGVKECVPNDSTCSTISENETQHPDATPSAGFIVYSWYDFIAQGLRMQHNIAHTLAGGGNVDLTRCLLTDNSVSGALLSGYRGRIHSCTIANNVIGDSYVMRYDNDGYGGYVDLAYDIVDQPGHMTVYWYSSSYPGGFDASYIMANSIAGLPQDNPSVVAGTPSFVDEANGDYHLSPIVQLALDFGQQSNFDYLPDLDGMPGAPVDLAEVPNYLTGSADLGAYERQNFFANCGTADSVFCNGFQP